MKRVTATGHEKPEARPARKGVRQAVAGILALREQIAAKNRGKPRLSAADIKSWIEEGRH